MVSQVETRAQRTGAEPDDEQQARASRPRTRRRNRRGEGGRLRYELIEAARQLLRTADHESDVSIRAVTRAVGAAPQSFYLQFANLDDLLYQVYAIEFDALRQALAAAAEGAGDPAAALLAMCRAYCDYAQAHPGRYRALTGVRGQAHDNWAPIRMPGMPAFVALRDAVAAALSAAGRDTDPTAAAATLWAGLHGVVTLRADRPAFPWPSLDDMLAILLASYCGPDQGSIHRDQRR
jgi:AcrR family transcriptional regulator